MSTPSTPGKFRQAFSGSESNLKDGYKGLQAVGSNLFGGLKNAWNTKTGIGGFIVNVVTGASELATRLFKVSSEWTGRKEWRSWAIGIVAGIAVVSAVKSIFRKKEANAELEQAKAEHQQLSAALSNETLGREVYGIDYDKKVAETVRTPQGKDQTQQQGRV